ncbi:alpha-glucan phosphorylase, H isozyme-like [Hibiscus syriacus]|uniref:alpha-glucan phosphorylase, H isozyme-like n=1 Tax=Hibiscus syriacus TaxID=106335 RepID=UPI0019211162|nr:alpha-glucan phosphorylase, H isozyme-like [Hibiscus syriacus]
MKFLMNGCLLLATSDGSTIEMIEEIGQDNMFLFGSTVHEVVALREKGPALKVPLQVLRVVRMIRDGHFRLKEYFKSLCDKIEGVNDYFLLGADFASYLEAQAAADKAFVDEERWTRMSILSAAGSGRFSSDRTIQEYAENALTCGVGLVLHINLHSIISGRELIRNKTIPSLTEVFEALLEALQIRHLHFPRAN